METLDSDATLDPVAEGKGSEGWLSCEPFKLVLC